MSEIENKRLLKSIGYRVKAERENMGLTQEQFADKYGYARTTLAKLEAGLRDFKSTEIITLAEQLNVSCDYLLRDTKCKKADNQEINDRLGLSEKAIEELEKLNNMSTGNKFVFLPHVNRQRIAAINILLENELNGINIFEQIAIYLLHDYEALPLAEDAGFNIDRRNELTVLEKNSKTNYRFSPSIISKAAIVTIQEMLFSIKSEINKAIAKEKEATDNGDEN